MVAVRSTATEPTQSNRIRGSVRLDRMVQSSRGKTHHYEVYALLWVAQECENSIRNLLLHKFGIPAGAIQRGLHLTVYHGRRPLPGLVPGSQSVHFGADVRETRFMVLAPGGENPRPALEPSQRSVGIRLTKRNRAIDEIQRLRASIYRLETPEVVGTRKRTTSWTNCFGARRYQPHIKLLRPGSEIERDLTILGTAFRSEIERINFDRFEVKCRSSDRPRHTRHRFRSRLPGRR